MVSGGLKASFLIPGISGKDVKTTGTTKQTFSENYTMLFSGTKRWFNNSKHNNSDEWLLIIMNTFIDVIIAYGYMVIYGYP